MVKSYWQRKLSTTSLIKINLPRGKHINYLSPPFIRDSSRILQGLVWLDQESEWISKNSISLLEVFGVPQPYMETKTSFYGNPVSARISGEPNPELYRTIYKTVSCLGLGMQQYWCTSMAFQTYF